MVIYTIDPSKKSELIRVNISSVVKKLEVSSEFVTVPQGTSVKIRRARTVEHNLELTSFDETEEGAELKVKDIISAHIIAEIERKQGQSYKKSELVEYEINLSGEKNTKYMLVWKDKWRTGTIKFLEKRRNKRIIICFQRTNRVRNTNSRLKILRKMNQYCHRAFKI
jgi:hypothetical protein